MMFKIGDRVNRDTATVVAVIRGDIYCKYVTIATDYSAWDKFPNWQSQFVVMLLFDEPALRWTYEEFKDFSIDGYVKHFGNRPAEETIRWFYENNPNLYQEVMWLPESAIQPDGESK